MAEKWEMLILSPLVSKKEISIFSPGIPIVIMTTNTYIEKQGGTARWNVTAIEAMPYLLADGWEPFTGDERSIYFKRKFTP